MNDKDILFEIVSKYNSVLSNRGLLKSLLADYYMDNKRIQNLLLMVYDEGIVDEVKDLLEIQKSDILKYEKRLEFNYAIDHKMAKDILEAWFFALNIKLNKLADEELSHEKLKDNYECIAEDDCFITNLEVTMLDKNVIFDNLYQYMKNHYCNNAYDLTAQLAFIEVLQSTIKSYWYNNRDSNTLKALVEEYYSVEKNVIAVNINIDYMLKYIRSEMLIYQGKIDDVIEIYYELLNWNLLKNSVKYKNSLEDIYQAVVCNLYQFLLMKGNSINASHVYNKYNDAIVYALDICKDQLDYAKDENDEELIKQWESEYVTIANGKIGRIYTIEDLDGYVYTAVHQDKKYRSMIQECLGSVNSEDTNEAIYLNVFCSSISLEKKADGYYIKNQNGRKIFDLI